MAVDLSTIPPGDIAKIQGALGKGPGSGLSGPMHMPDLAGLPGKDVHIIPSFGGAKGGGKTKGAASPDAPPQSLADQIAGLGLPSSLMPAEHTAGFAQYLDAVNKVQGSKLDKSVKDQLLNTLSQNYQAEQQRQAQEPSQLAYQAFYNQT